MEDNNTRFSGTGMFWKDPIVELLVFEFDIPSPTEKPGCNHRDVDLITRQRERDTKCFLCEQDRRHFEAALLQRHRTLTLFGLQSNGLRIIDWLPIEAHMNAEALRFLRRYALGQQYSIKTKQ